MRSTGNIVVWERNLFEWKFVEDKGRCEIYNYKYIQIFNPTLKEMLVIFIFSLQDGKNKTILKA